MIWHRIGAGIMLQPSGQEVLERLGIKEAIFQTVGAANRSGGSTCLGKTADS